MKGFITAVLGFSAVLCFQASSAMAGDPNELELEAITVTSQKQEENVREVPMGITVLDSAKIEDAQIESIAELAGFVPNFLINDEGAPGMNSPVIRGIYANALTMTASAGLFIDGVPILSAVGFEDTLLDIERVEVLRGPQGTLYGKNTETGAINIITRQPDNEFRANVTADVGRMLSAETGDGLKQSYSLNISGPIQEDTLYFGFSGRFYKKDGFIKNIVTDETVDDRENRYGRAQLRWTPSKKLDISLVASNLQYDDGAFNMRLTDMGAAAYGLTPAKDREDASNIQGNNKASSDTQSLKIKYDLSDSLTLTSVTANRVYNDKASADWDFSQATIMHSYKDNIYTKLSQELRLDYSSEALRWLVGMYYDNDVNEFNSVMEMAMMSSTTNRDITGQAHSVFGQVNYALTSELHMIAGLRYEVQKQELKNYISDTKEDDSWDEVSPKLALEYDLTPNIMTYASISKGYQSGGFNAGATDTQYISFDEEKLWSYEIGFKSLFNANRIMLNGCLFLMDITDMQVTESVTPMTSYVTNAAEATSKGVELEMTAKISDSLTTMGSFGYNIGEFDDFTDANGDYNGNKLPYAPAYNFSIGGQYRFKSGFYARADIIGYGETYLDKANDYKKDAYNLVNTRVGYETENLDLYLYGKNIFDENHDTNGYYDGYYVVYADPGEVGLKATYRF